MTQSPSDLEHVASSPVAEPRRRWLQTAGKIALYSFFAFSAGTLVAAKYVPEIATALSFLLPAEEPPQCCSHRMGRSPGTDMAAYGSCCSESSCCSSAGECPASGGCPSEMLVAEVDSSPVSEADLAAAENPPIPPVVD